MGQKVKFGIVGLGHIGRRHAQHIIANNRADLIAVYDLLPIEKLKIDELKKDLFVQSFQDLLQLNLDVVNICTPNYLHATMAVDVLNSDTHVVIEKPMALSVRDARLIIETANKVRKCVFCVMQNRFSPTIIWLKQIITANYLGKINLLSVNCFWNRNENYYLNSTWHGSKIKDGGPLFTQFSHFIDIVYWLFGEPVDLRPDFYSFNKKKYIEFEDSGIVKLAFKNKMVGVLNYSTAVWNKNLESSITIIGEFGSVKIGGQYMDQIIYCDIKDYILPKLDFDIKCNDYGNYKGSASNHDQMIDNVIDVLLNHVDIHTNSYDGLNVVKIIEKIYSYRN